MSASPEVYQQETLRDQPDPDVQNAGIMLGKFMGIPGLPELPQDQDGIPANHDCTRCMITAACGVYTEASKNGGNNKLMNRLTAVQQLTAEGFNFNDPDADAVVKERTDLLSQSSPVAVVSAEAPVQKPAETVVTKTSMPMMQEQAVVSHKPKPDHQEVKSPPAPEPVVIQRTQPIEQSKSVQKPEVREVVKSSSDKKPERPSPKLHREPIPVAKPDSTHVAVEPVIPVSTPHEKSEAKQVPDIRTIKPPEPSRHEVRMPPIVSRKEDGIEAKPQKKQKRVPKQKNIQQEKTELTKPAVHRATEKPAPITIKKEAQTTSVRKETPSEVMAVEYQQQPSEQKPVVRQEREFVPVPEQAKPFVVEDQREVTSTDMPHNDDEQVEELSTDVVAPDIQHFSDEQNESEFEIDASPQNVPSPHEHISVYSFDQPTEVEVSDMPTEEPTEETTDIIDIDTRELDEGTTETEAPIETSEFAVISVFEAHEDILASVEQLFVPEVAIEHTTEEAVSAIQSEEQEVPVTEEVHQEPVKVEYITVPDVIEGPQTIAEIVVELIQDQETPPFAVLVLASEEPLPIIPPDTESVAIQSNPVEITEQEETAPESEEHDAPEYPALMLTQKSFLQLLQRSEGVNQALEFLAERDHEASAEDVQQDQEASSDFNRDGVAIQEKRNDTFGHYDDTVIMTFWYIFQVLTFIRAAHLYVTSPSASSQGVVPQPTAQSHP